MFHDYRFFRLKFCWQVVALVGRQQIRHRVMLGRKNKFPHACLKIFRASRNSNPVCMYIYIYICSPPPPKIYLLQLCICDCFICILETKKTKCMNLQPCTHFQPFISNLQLHMHFQSFKDKSSNNWRRVAD